MTTRTPVAKPRTTARKAPAKSRAATKKPGTSKAAPKTQTAKAPVKRRVAPKKPTAKPRRRSSSRTPKPKGLEASYSGRIFRSRLEARWALLLDSLGIDWDYEPSFYQVGPALFYLPDFYLPRLETWLEVKGIPFMDADSMAKVLAAVAGPMPIPLREAPHSASSAMLLGGTLHTPQPGLRPVHALVTTGAPGKANISYATLGESGLSLMGKPWLVEPATGIKKARRPLAPRLTQLLDPPMIDGRLSGTEREAYRCAAAASFDTQGRLETSGLPTRALARRAGRWLPPTPFRAVGSIAA